MRIPLHFDRVAPGGITLPFLLAAPFFGALAALLLFFTGSDVLLSRWHPALIGALHVYTIGFLLFSMAGALLQIGPVMTARTALQSERAARWMRFSFGGGALLFGCGMIHPVTWLLVSAFALLSTGFVMWLSACLRGIGFTSTASGLLLATGGLAVGVAIGLRLLAGHAFPEAGLPRHLTDLHATWMLFGGIAPLVMAVGVVVIPMFQHTQPFPRFARWLPFLAVGGMLVESFPAAPVPGVALSIAALLLFALTVLFMQTRRRRGAVDATVRLYQLAMLCAIVGSLAWSIAPLVPAWHNQLQWFGGVMLIVGFAGSCVQGMTLKIVPFLLRLRLQRLLWQQRHAAINLPGFQQLLHERHARVQPVLQMAAVMLFGIAAVFRADALFVVAATMLLLAQLVLGLLLLSAFRNSLQSAMTASTGENGTALFNEGST